MKNRVLYLLVLLCFANLQGYTQNASPDSTGSAEIFDKLSRVAKEYRFDTTAPPNDKTTRKIIELRKLRGGFNVNEVMEYKLQEEKHKNEVPAAELDKLSAFFAGDGKRWLNNAVIHIYRKHFSYAELEDIVAFYKTAGGRKMASVLPVIMVEALAAGEMTKKIFEAKQQSTQAKDRNTDSAD